MLVVVGVVKGAFSSTCATLIESRSTTAACSGADMSSENSSLFGRVAPESST